MIECGEVRALEIFPGGIILILYLGINLCDYIVANSQNLIIFCRLLYKYITYIHHVDTEEITL